MDDELRAWLLDQSKQAHYFADHPDGQPGDPGGHFDKGAAHMADATLTWISERRDIALRAAAHPDTAGEPGEDAKQAARSMLADMRGEYEG